MILVHVVIFSIFFSVYFCHPFFLFPFLSLLVSLFCFSLPSHLFFLSFLYLHISLLTVISGFHVISMLFIFINFPFTISSFVPLFYHSSSFFSSSLLFLCDFLHWFNLSLSPPFVFWCNTFLPSHLPFLIYILICQDCIDNMAALLYAYGSTFTFNYNVDHVSSVFMNRATLFTT